MTTTNHVSLYEYLGKRAGKELGGKVFKTAKEQRIKIISKDVNQGGYVGKVMCYPSAFLAEYFTNNTIDNKNTHTSNVNEYKVY